MATTWVETLMRDPNGPGGQRRSPRQTDRVDGRDTRGPCGTLDGSPEPGQGDLARVVELDQSVRGEVLEKPA